MVKLVPMSDLAELADKFTRNEIVTSNEFRGFIGMKPSSDKKADELRNSNMPQPLDIPVDAAVTPEDAGVDVVNGAFDEVDKSLDDIFSSLGEDPNDSG